MLVVSREPTALAYDGRLPHDDQNPASKNHLTNAAIPQYVKPNWRLVILPGLNTVSEEDFDILSQDVNFQRHEKEGVMTVQDDIEAPEHDARSDEDNAFIAQWEGMSDADKAAMYPGLTDDQRRLVPAPVAANAKSGTTIHTGQSDNTAAVSEPAIKPNDTAGAPTTKTADVGKPEGSK